MELPLIVLLLVWFVADLVSCRYLPSYILAVRSFAVVPASMLLLWKSAGAYKIRLVAHVWGALFKPPVQWERSRHTRWLRTASLPFYGLLLIGVRHGRRGTQPAD